MNVKYFNKILFKLMDKKIKPSNLFEASLTVASIYYMYLDKYNNNEGKNAPWPRNLAFGKCLFHLHNISEYCNFRNFRESFIFANNVKRHICDVEIRHQNISNLHQ